MVDIERVRELKNSGMSYSEVAAQVGVSKQYIAQLLSDKEARAELIAKSGGRCERCGKESNRLQAHHTDYNSSPDVVLCVKCHKQIHAGTSDRPALTSSEKQSRRVSALDAIAQAAGWGTWTRYETGVKNGVVKIERNHQEGKMETKMHSIVVRYPRKQNGKTGEFENWYRMEKKFSNQENAEKWARECEQDVERDKGNLWPTDVLVDGVSVESSDKIYTRF